MKLWRNNKKKWELYKLKAYMSLFKLFFPHLSHPPIGSTTMSLGRSRFSHIRTVRMLPSALETSIRSVPAWPRTQHNVLKFNSTQCYASECIRNTIWCDTMWKEAIYQHQSSTACWLPSQSPDLLGSPDWCPPPPEAGTKTIWILSFHFAHNLKWIEPLSFEIIFVKKSEIPKKKSYIIVPCFFCFSLILDNFFHYY